MRDQHRYSEPQPESHSIESRFMQMGDRIVVEPHDGENFEATVVVPLGWGLVHGVMDWRMRRIDNGEEFTYGIHVNAPVLVVPPGATTAAGDSEDSR